MTNALTVERGRSLAWEFGGALLLSAGVAVLGGQLELHEAMFTFSRRWEALQLDEWPMAALVFAVCASGIAWRRYRQASRELSARRVAESELSIALAENRLLAQQQLTIQEAERKHLARELHDELGQYLNAIKLDAVQMHSTSGAHIVETVDHLHGVVSDMIRRLRPSGLDELGLTAALESCIDQWRRRLPATVFEFSHGAGLDDLGEALSLALYRLIQEGLTNCARHAQASQVDVMLQRVGDADGHRIELLISDNGVGMESTASQSGHGLAGMRERVQLLGGHFAIDAAPGRGTSIEVRLPLEQLP